MAQGTGAKRLLALCRKSASAGVVPALAGVGIGGLVDCGAARATSETGATTPPRGVSTTAAEGSGSRHVDGGASAQKVASKPEGKDSPSDQVPAHGVRDDGVYIVPPKGPRERAPSAKEIEQATVASVTLTSPSLSPEVDAVAPLRSIYTCDDKNDWPVLSWQGVPWETAELALFATNVQPVAGKLFFDWTVAGIDPALTGLGASSLPRGTVVGRNSLGKRAYSICPALGSLETYMFALYALPKRLSPPPGFDSGAFRQQVLAVSGNAGLLPVSYGRG
jgi:phosphatidylethanolamine-binding protein (PEBP) family uncharacterized protein